MLIIQTNWDFGHLVTLVQTQIKSSVLTSPWTREVCSFVTGIEITFLTSITILSKVGCCLSYVGSHFRLLQKVKNEFHSHVAGHALPEGDHIAQESVQGYKQGCQQQWQFSSSSDAKQSSQAHQSDWMVSARLELWNPQTSLTFLNQVLFTTLKQLQSSAATHGVWWQRVPKSALPLSNTCWKTTRLQ